MAFRKPVVVFLLQQNEPLAQIGLELQAVTTRRQFLQVRGSRAQFSFLALGRLRSDFVHLKPPLSQFSFRQRTRPRRTRHTAVVAAAQLHRMRGAGRLRSFFSHF